MITKASSYKITQDQLLLQLDIIQQILEASLMKSVKAHKVVSVSQSERTEYCKNKVVA